MYKGGPFLRVALLRRARASRVSLRERARQRYDRTPACPGVGAGRGYLTKFNTGFASKCYHRLIYSPHDKGIFPKTAVTLYKIEQPLHLLPQDPIWTPVGCLWPVKCLILVVRNLKCAFSSNVYFLTDSLHANNSNFQGIWVEFLKLELIKD